MNLLAQVNIKDVMPVVKDNPQFQTLGGLVSYFVPKILIVGGIACFIIVVITGFGMVVGAGNADPHAAESRKNILTYAVIGFTIMFCSYWIIQIINYVTNNSLSSILG